jgi:hypothetical protein
VCVCVGWGGGVGWGNRISTDSHKAGLDAKMLLLCGSLSSIQEVKWRS